MSPWRSLVAHLPDTQKVAGSIPAGLTLFGARHETVPAGLRDNLKVEQFRRSIGPILFLAAKRSRFNFLNPWRNWLAHLTFNQRVVGSSPTGFTGYGDGLSRRHEHVTLIQYHRLMMHNFANFGRLRLAFWIRNAAV